ncbi:dsDNA nuclease domain-containing protein [Streptomyces sp. NPDC005648]|uniref:dsDNA nuclease domain-containing protein n=1 Tax=Streptomyces sp. NPDC005648 TaxID=3157044 RepID=UPI0033BD0D7F
MRVISPAGISEGEEPEENEGVALAALEATPSPDNSGIVTFGKYRYQAKVAALLWLSCLQDEGPVAIICEHIDDIVLVWEDRVEFRQVKTRIPGRASWTFSEVCKDGGGIDSLMRSHLAFQKGSSGLNVTAAFSLWLEGASSLKDQTAKFFKQPNSVSGDDRSKVLSLARAVADDQKCTFNDEDVVGFLGALAILSNRVNEQDIDNMLFAALAEALPNTRVINVVQAGIKLVQRAEDAQAGTLVTRKAQEFMLAVGLAPSTGKNPLERQTLTRQELISLLPDDPALGQAQLNALLTSGNPISNLRRKLILACASQEVQAEAASLQAVADSRRLEILASSISAEEKLAELAEEVLDHGRTVASRRANSTIPGQEVFLDLKHDRLILRQLDVEGLFPSRHGQLGYLCCLSDECEYSWRAS